ncbi:MAG: amidase [Gemmatimonadaceae bacterium]|nr:amidase [Gemmatimonadaceae bacterium]
MSALTPFTDLQDIAKAVTHRQASPVDLVRDILDAIGRHNPSLNAYITVTGDAALEAADKVEKLVAAKKDPGPLAGVPIAIKDLILTSDAPTTAGSKVFGDGIPAGDEAPVVKRLRKAGAIILGKTNLHEVALGVTSANEHFGPARNPWNAEHVAGGSSGGSGAAVAAGLCAAAVGTDTRGSIRIPAACCGVTGFKPTYGLLPNEGIVPLSPSLDHVGPMTHTVADAAIMLGVMTGAKGGVERFVKALRHSSKGLVVGVSEYHLRDLDGEIAKAIDKALKVLRPLVKEIRDVEIPALEGAQEASGVITASEAIAYHDRYLKHNPAAYGPLVRKRLEGGYKHSALDYLNAMARRETVRAAFAQTFAEVDVLVGATLPALPPRINEQVVHIDGREVNAVEAFTRFNAPQNLAGLPALSVPCGLAKGLPIGLQFFAAEGADEQVLAIGAAFQRETHWHQRRPPIAR